jgi:hypothetical protein
MRFMMFVKGNAESESGQLPSEEMIAAMTRYNEELQKAGVLLDLNGLHPTSDGARVRYSAGKTTVVDGPFAEAKEVVAGYWIIQVKSKEEAIEWAKRVPFDAGGLPADGEAEIEIRQIFELDEFGSSEAVERARKLGDEMAKRA